MSAPTIAAVLAGAKAMGVDRLDAQLLLARALACPRSWLLAHDDASLDAPQAVRVNADLLRRARGEPLAYILGEKEFHGLMLHVNANVLVPRPETETLVDWGLALMTGALARVPRPRVLDLGTGSGAIALALKHALSAARVVGVDVSPDALAVAGGNALRLGLAIDFRQGNWWDELGGQRFDLVVSNPPYIEPGDPHLLALGHEPRIALTADGNGLAALAAIVSGAPDHLESGAWLLLEHGRDQAAQVTSMLVERGFSDVRTLRDMAGQPRCTGACR